MLKTKQILSEDIDVELSINDDALNHELMEQPLKYRKWSGFEAKASKAVRNLNLQLEHAKSTAYVKAKSDAGTRKLTVKDLDAIVTLDADVMRLEAELIQAEEIHANMKTAVRAFLQRHDALKDLAANKRKELID